MNNNNLEKVKNSRDSKDIVDAVKKFAALQAQIKNPTRDGMIYALSDAQSVAGDEILQIEHLQGDTIPTPWSCFPNQELYRKLPQYQEGLRQHCIKKIGQKAFEELLKEMVKHGESTF